MGFLERIGLKKVDSKSIQDNTAVTSPYKNYFEFHNSKQGNLAYNIDLSKALEANKKFATSVDFNEANLALIQPIRFIRKYVNEATINNAIKNNPRISKIIKENNLNIEFNYENVNSIIMSHLIPTCKTAQRLYCNMGHDKKEITYLYLTQAALLHDIGKGFIPSEILNKKGKLTLKERATIELHNLLSYEILITTDLNPIVAKLTHEHHDYEKNVTRNHENQALTISDVYCALKEDRPYKKPLNDICAKIVLYDMGTKGSFDSQYISYLNI